MAKISEKQFNGLKQDLNLAIEREKQYLQLLSLFYDGKVGMTAIKRMMVEYNMTAIQFPEYNEFIYKLDNYKP